MSNEVENTENSIDEVPSIGAPSLKAGIEAILLVVDEPVSAITLAQITNSPQPQVIKTLKDIQKEFETREGGITLREIAGGWRFYTNEHSGEVVERFLKDGQTARLTQASLETLAVIAYKQPVSRGRVAAIRGVNVDGVVRTLLNRGLIEEAGSDNESQVTLEQESPLADLYIRWIGSEQGEVQVTAEFDESSTQVNLEVVQDEQ